MSLYDAGDAFLYPIDITTANNVIQFVEAGTPRTITIPPDTYYAYLDGGDLLRTHEPLFAAVLDRMNINQPTHRYSLQAVGLGAERPFWGLTWQRTAGSGAWGFNAAGSTFDLRLLGLRAGENAVVGGDEIATEEPFLGCWRSPRPARRKLYDVRMEQHTNSGRGALRQVTRWGEDQIRMFEYAMVPAAFVRPGRSLLADYATVAQINSGDDKNVFFDFWRAGVSSYRDVLCAHSGANPLFFYPGIYGASQGFEVLSSAVGSDFATSFESCLQDEPINAEHYRVRFAMRVLQSEYQQ